MITFSNELEMLRVITDELWNQFDSNHTQWEADALAQRILGRLKNPSEIDKDISWLGWLSTRLNSPPDPNKLNTYAASEIARLRALANWAECPPPTGWNGTVDKQEMLRAIADALQNLKGAQNAQENPQAQA